MNGKDLLIDLGNISDKINLGAKGCGGQRGTEGPAGGTVQSAPKRAVGSFHGVSPFWGECTQKAYRTAGAGSNPQKLGNFPVSGNL